MRPGQPERDVRPRVCDVDGAPGLATTPLPRSDGIEGHPSGTSLHRQGGSPAGSGSGGSPGPCARGAPSPPPTRNRYTASYPPSCEGRSYGQAGLLQPGVVARVLTESLLLAERGRDLLRQADPATPATRHVP